MNLARKGDCDAAIKKYQQVLEEKPKSPDAYAGQVRCYLKQGDARQAYETATKGLQVSDSWVVRVALGEVYFRQGKIPEAEKEWVTVINGGHQAARAYLGLARVRWAIAMNKSAKALIDKAHELDPGDPDIQREWIGSLFRAERAKALESYRAESKGADADIRRTSIVDLKMTNTGQTGSRGACRLVSDVTATETELVPLLSDPSHLRGMGLSLTINGQKSTLRLDTGAGGITINRKLAERAGVQRAADVQIGGIGDKGALQGYGAYADSIRVGNLEFRDCPVEVFDRRSAVDEDGFIGADVFERFLIEIDFPKRKLRLSQLPARPGETPAKPSLATDTHTDEDVASAESGAEPADTAGNGAAPTSFPRYFDRYISPEMNSYARVFRFHHMLLVPTKINDLPGKLFLIDSGAFNNMITPDAAREVTKVHGDSDTRVRGLSGEVNKVYETGTVVLEFGALRQKNTDMVAFDLSSVSRSIGTEVSGTLGFPMLNLLKIKLDYRDALVNFEYVPNPWMR